MSSSEGQTDILNHFGKDRWELVGLLATEQGKFVYFKRQIEPDIPVYKDGVKLEFSKKYSYESCLDGYVIYDLNNRILSGSEVEALLNKEGI